MKNKERIYILDIIRAMAIILICLNHAISIFYVDQISYNTFESVSIASKSFMVISYIISRLGVPLFLFLTGVLVLSKKFENQKEITDFYKKNLLTFINIYNRFHIRLYISSASIFKPRITNCIL